jgi:chromosome segregation ATPase
VLTAQTSPANQNPTETLTKEVQQLRLAIERSSLLSSRTQVIIAELQIHEAAVARLTQQYYEVRTDSVALSARRSELTKKIQELEAKVSSASPGYYEKEILQAKAELGDAVDADQRSSVRQSEVASQLNAEQTALADTRSRMAELRKQLDEAIQRLPKSN